MIRKITCIVCPRGCEMTADTETLEVNGNTCPKGEEYARAEILNPTRTLTSTVPVKNRENAVLSVKTAEPIPKDKIFEALEALKRISAEAPVNIGDVILADAFGTNVVATKNIE